MRKLELRRTVDFSSTVLNKYLLFALILISLLLITGCLSEEEESLFNSVKAGNEKNIIALLEKGVDVNVKNKDDATPLHCAPTKEIAEMLISRGADINAKDKDGQTPLLNVFNLGFMMPQDGTCDEEIVKLLIDKGADVNTKDKYGKTPLICASIINNEEIIKLLIDKGADVNAKDNDSTTPISCALKFGNDEIFKLLILKGIDVNAKDEYGETPILKILNKSENKINKIDEEIINMLIDRGADINAKDNNGRTPLSILLDKGVYYNEKIIKLLIDKGADVNAKDTDGMTPISNLFSNFCNGETIVKLLLDKGADINAKDNNGRTPLSIFLDKHNYDIDETPIKLLLDRGADINAKDNNGKTPLSIFLYEHKDNINEKIIKFLLDNGVNVNAKDNDGISPLHLINNEAIAKLLIKKGADVNAKDNSGMTPLYGAMFNGKYYNEAFARLLIENGANVNVKDKNGKTPLHVVSNEAVAKLLIHKGADVNAKDNFGKSPLHGVSSKTITKVLIDNGADINAKDKNERTPLHQVIFDEAGYDVKNIVELLINRGAEVNVKDKNGKTPLYLAIEKDNRDVYDILCSKTDAPTLSNLAMKNQKLFLRQTAIKYIKDQDLLKKLLLDKMAAIREVVVKLITDEDFLTEKFFEEPSLSVRNAIIKNLKKNSILKLIATTAYNRSDREMARKRVADLSLPLSEIDAFNYHLKERQQVISKISDQSMLLEIILRHEFDILCIQAAKKLTNNDELYSVAIGSIDKEVLKIVLSKITDETILVDISLRATDPVMRKAAMKKSGTDWSILFDRASSKQYNSSSSELANTLAAVTFFDENTSGINTIIQNACLNLIRLGDESRIPEMVTLLNTYGDKTLAEDYLNCGQPDLNIAARTWGTNRGYDTSTGYGSNRASWGR